MVAVAWFMQGCIKSLVSCSMCLLVRTVRTNTGDTVYITDTAITARILPCSSLQMNSTASKRQSSHEDEESTANWGEKLAISGKSQR